MSIIAGTYVSIFLIFMLIKNYEEIKLILEKVQFKITSLVVVKNTNSKFDFTKFFLFSILITFSIDIILTKISQQSIIEYILDNIPGLGDTATTIGYDPKSSLDSSQSPSDKFENVKDALGQFIGPSVGAIILFFLRQLNYREKSRGQTNKSPGARILFLFIAISLIAFISDIYNTSLKGISIDFISILEESNSNLISKIANSNPTNIIPSTDLNQTLTIASNTTNIIPYTINHIIIFTLSNLIIPQFYMSIIAIWIFDWYLFSKYWIKISEKKLK